MLCYAISKRGGVFLGYAIEVSGIVKNFGDVHALAGVSLKVREGAIYGLLGPNGAGKTTLVRHMATLLQPTKGSVLVGGIDALKHPEQVRQMIGLAGQFASVDEFLTGRENLEMVAQLYHLPRKVAKERAEEILKKFRLIDAADRTVKTYSGGMRRRLDLGAALVVKPEIIFLDEPTTGLDPRTRLELWEVIRELKAAGTTIMLTTQYLEEADELADYIGVIDEGRLIEEGTSDELKNRMGGDMVEFTLVDPSEEKEAMKAVRNVAKKKPTYTKETRKVTVPVVNGSKSLLKIARALDEAKIEPKEISLHRPSLDDVFLAITGKKSQPKATKEKGGKDE